MSVNQGLQLNLLVVIDGGCWWRLMGLQSCQLYVTVTPQPVRQRYLNLGQSDWTAKILLCDVLTANWYVHNPVPIRA